MSNLFKSGLVVALFGLLAACGNANDADHPHDAAAEAHGHGHDGDDDGHAHDGAAHKVTETEAFYDEQAAAPAEPAGAEMDDEHHHDGEPHEHQH